MGGRKSGMCLRTAAATPAFNKDDGATKDPKTHQQRQIQPGLEDHQNCTGSRHLLKVAEDKPCGLAHLFHRGRRRLARIGRYGNRT